MASADIKLECKVTQVRVIFWPVATFDKVGDASKLTIFGVPIYQQLGDKKKLLWWSAGV